MAAVLVVAAGVGCAPQTPEPIVLPSASASASAAPTAPFDTEDEALAAATEAYERYLRVSDEIGHAGWRDAQGYDEVAGGELLEEERSTAARLKERGYRTTGWSRFDSVSVHERGRTRLTVILCLDVSATDVIDRQGNSVLNGRQSRLPLLVELTRAAGAFLVTRSDVWPDDEYC